MKYSFKSDYCELAHPEILKAFSAVGNTQFVGYGMDEYSKRAAKLVREKIKAPDADVHFIAGGTHANLVAISSMLRSHEAVIAPISGHIFVHEGGAIEATGHKICTVESPDGKLVVGDIDRVLKEHDDEHMVSPRLVYISQSTEVGTIYSKMELFAIFQACQRNGLILYIDGARLGNAINSHLSDLTYEDIASMTDAFFLGGTKNGAMFGEAIVINNETLKKDFRTVLKQRGGLLSKGAAIGIQFEALLKDGLYDSLACHSNRMALKLADGIARMGYELLSPAQTNMIFPIFPAKIVAKLREKYDFHDWKKANGMITIRLVTSWATPENVIDEFIDTLSKFNL